MATENPYLQFVQTEAPANPYEQFLAPSPEPTNPYEQFLVDEPQEPQQSDWADAGGMVARGALDTAVGGTTEGILRIAQGVEADFAPRSAAESQSIKRRQDLASEKASLLQPFAFRHEDEERAAMASPARMMDFERRNQLTPARNKRLTEIDLELAPLRTVTRQEQSKRLANTVAAPLAAKTQEFRQAVRDVYPVDKEFEQSLLGGVIGGTSQMVASIPAYLTGLGLPAAAGQMFDAGYQDAIASGADEMTALSSGALNLPGATLEFAADRLALGGVLDAYKAGSITKQALAKQVASKAAQSIAAESATEGTQQVLQNTVARGLYDSDRELTEGVGKAALVGGLTGGLVSTATTVGGEGMRRLDNRRSGTAAPELDTAPAGSPELAPAEPAPLLPTMTLEQARADVASQPIGSPQLEVSNLPPAIYVGRQELPPGAAELGITGESFKLTDSIPGHPAGSNVSRPTLEAAGYRVPATPDFLAGTSDPIALAELELKAAPTPEPSLAGGRDASISDGSGTATPYEEQMMADWRSSISSGGAPPSLDVAPEGIALDASTPLLPPLTLDQARADVALQPPDSAPLELATNEAPVLPPPPPVSTPESDGSAMPERTTALNKAEITQLRQVYALDALPAPQRQRWEQVLNQAKEKGLSSTAEALAASILENPRMVNAEEHAAMNIRAAELQNQYESLLGQAAEEFDKGNVHRGEELRRASDNILSSLDLITEASDRTGTEIGRALSIRRMRINRETYRLADIVTRAQIAKQSRLTPEQTEEFRKLSDQIAAQESKITELEAALAPALALEAELKAKTFVEEGRSRRSEARRQSAGTRRTALKQELAKLGYRTNDITNVVGLSFEAATIIAKIADTYIDEGVSNLSDLVAALQETIPDLSTQDIYNAVGRRIQKEAKKIETEAKRRLKDLQKQARLAAKVNDAMEGKFDKAKAAKSSPEAEELRGLLRELRLMADQTSRDDASLAAIHEKINAVQDQISGGYRNIPEGRPDENPEVARARETLADLRKEMAKIDRGLLAKTDAEKETARVTRQIEAIENQIRDGEVFSPARKQAPESPENKALRDRLAALKYERQNIRDTLQAKSFDAVTPEEINVERRKSIAEQITEVEKQLEGGFRNIPKKTVADEVSTAQVRKDLKELQRLLRTEDAIADLEEQIRTGDYKVSGQEQRVIQNSQLEKALVKRQQLQRDVNNRIEQMRKKTLGEQLVEPFNISRALVLTADMSAVLRQGIVLSARRPVAASKAFAQAFGAFFSQNRADAIDLAIRRNPNQIERDKAGLYLADIGGTINKKEEAFASNLAQRIPGVGAVVRASERNMATTLNLIRSSAFDQFTATYPEATLEQKEAFARYINVASGRGELGKFAAAAKPLSTIFLAPRFAISRFQTPLALVRNWKDPVVRREIAKDFLAFSIMGMTILGLAAAAGVDVGDDPESPDFGKMVVGNTRIDIWAGLQQPVRLVLQPILAGLDRAGIRETQKDIDLIDAGRRFLSYKLSPAVNLPSTLLTGKNVIGQEQTAPETLLRSITPLIVQETAEIYQADQDASKAALSAGLQFFGVGVNENTPKSQTAQNTSPAETRRKERAQERAERRKTLRSRTD